jgi:PII-like signaling protein
MKIEGEARLVTIYVNSTDQWQGRPLYSAIVDLCKEKGIAGASVSSCVEGYGASGRLHTQRLLELGTGLPVRIEAVDLPERIDHLLAALEGMLEEGLVTVMPVHVLRCLADPDSGEKG